MPFVTFTVRRGLSAADKSLQYPNLRRAYPPRRHRQQPADRLRPRQCHLPKDYRAEDAELSHPCPCCGGRMVIIETFQRGSSPRTRPAASTTAIRIDTS